MKKKVIIAISCVLVALLVVGGLWFFTREKEEKMKLAQSTNSVTASVIIDEEGSPIFVNGDRVSTKVEKEEDVFTALDELAKMYGYESAEKVFNILSVNESADFTYYKVQQKYEGVPVYGKQLVVAVNSDNKVVSVTGHYYNDLNVSTYSSNDIDDYETILNEKYGVDNYEVIDSNEYIYIDDENGSRYVYVYSIISIYDNGDLIVDAKTGDVLKFLSTNYNAAYEYTGEGSNGKKYTVTIDQVTSGIVDSYYIYDPNRNIKIIDAYDVAMNLGNPDNMTPENILNRFYLYIVREALPRVPMTALMVDGKLQYTGAHTVIDSLKGDVILSEAYPTLYNFEITYDYYNNILGRNSYDNNGAEIIVNINAHYNTLSLGENVYNNGSWNGTIQEFVIGTSDGVSYGVGLDIIAHEFTHSVSGNIVGLIYNGETGALNEAYSDIMGNLIEGKNWTLGEDLKTARDMARPNDYEDPAIKGEKYYFPDDEEFYNEEWRAEMFVAQEKKGIKLDKWQDWDYGGVHNNSGVPNHAAYLMYENGAFESREQMAKVWYNSLFLLTSTSDFEDCAYAVIQTAENLGLSEDKIKIIKEAFYATKMLEDDNYTLAGVVTDDDNDSVIEGVQVSVANKLNAAINYEVFTDKDGKYVFEELPEGEYDIVFDKAKYLPLEKEVELTKDKDGFDVSLEAIEEEDYEDAQVVFVMDISSSMFTSDPTDVRKRIIVNVLSSLDSRDDVALVIFAKNADTINNGLSDKAITKKVLMTDVYNISNNSGYGDNAGTNGKAGLKKAIGLFEEDTEKRKYIVFLTDGQDNISDDTSYDDLIKKANKKDIRVLTIGLGSEVDSSNLKKIATETNGRYYYADSSTDLAAFDYKIFAELE